KGEYGMAIPAFIESALSGNTITVYNGGSQSRSFCNISDVVEAIVGLITSERSWGHIFNIGNDISVPIKEVAEYIHNVCKSHSDIAYLTMPPERRGKSEIYRRLP